MKNKIKGCLFAGAIGDAIGSGFENINIKEDDSLFYPFGKPKVNEPIWNLTDDTQLTLATCETMLENQNIQPKYFANKFLEYFQQKKISGIGASTLKALNELEFGGHWSQVGRSGEFAAGNGAAMRIAPLAFNKSTSRKNIKDISAITHRNDEAYIGALCVYLAIKFTLTNKWTGNENLLQMIINEIPDTKVRDRLIEIEKIQFKKNLQEIGKLGNTGYVVDTVPLAIVAASKIKEIGLIELFNELVQIGGDVDTICSISGQISGSLIGYNEIPKEFILKLKTLRNFTWLNETIEKFSDQYSSIA